MGNKENIIKRETFYEEIMKQLDEGARGEIATGLIGRAKKGDTKAVEAIINLIGENPKWGDRRYKKYAVSNFDLLLGETETIEEWG